jgi:hypothetical protein
VNIPEEQGNPFPFTPQICSTGGPGLYIRYEYDFKDGFNFTCGGNMVVDFTARRVGFSIFLFSYFHLLYFVYFLEIFLIFSNQFDQDRKYSLRHKFNNS